MSTSAARAYMTIGDVLGRLQGEFPDVTISKIRFLEAEGLIEPERTPSGYRKFTVGDVERLRFILAAQRDQYLPLRVIKEQLESGAVKPPRTLVAAGTTAEQDVRLTRRQLLDGAGVTEEFLAELEEYGLVRRAAGHYDGDAMNVVRAAAELTRFGFGGRHLRLIRTAAEREVDLIEQVVAPLLRRRGPGAHEEAAEAALEVSALALRLHTVLVAAGLTDRLSR